VTRDRQRNGRTLTAVPLLLILLLAAGLRFYHLGAQSFWNDEGNTARLVERPVRLIIEGAAGDIHPPGYYLLLHGWRAGTGESEFALRAFSALCGVLTVAVAAASAAVPRRSKLAAWTAALLVAVHPLAVVYSQEARMYAQLGLATALTLFAALALARRNRTSTPGILPAAGLAASVGAGLYTHYAYGLALAGLNLAFGLFWLSDRPWRWSLLGRWIAAHAIGGLLFLPWAPIALGARGWQPPDLAIGTAVGDVSRTLVAGITLPESIPPGALLCAAALGLWAVLLSTRAWPDPLLRFTSWAALGMATIPPALLVGAELYRPAYLKFLVVSVAPLAVLLAIPMHKHTHSHTLTPSPGRAAIARMAVWGLLGGLLLVQIRSLHHLYNDPAYQRDNYRGIAQRLRDEGRAGDAILLSAPNQWEVFTYYYRAERGDTLDVYPAPYRPTTAEAETWVGDIVTAHPDARLFVLFWGDLESDPERAIERALASSAYKANDAWITSVRLARYGTGPLPTGPGVETDILLDNRLRLTGYNLPETTYSPEDCVPLTLFWQAEERIAEPLKVFVHLVDSDEALAAQADMEPNAGFLPTTVWQLGEQVVDRYGILLPQSLTPGSYTVRVGMYRHTGERLPITMQDALSGDHVDLALVTVAP